MEVTSLPDVSDKNLNSKNIFQSTVYLEHIMKLQK